MTDELYPRWDPDRFTLPGFSGLTQIMAIPATAAARAATRPKGTSCPCCGQHVQVYRRTIYKRMAACLVWLVKEYRKTNNWVSLKTGPIFRGGDNTKLLYWKLIERHPVTQDLYRPTQVALDFVAHRVTVPKYAYVYDGRVLGFSADRVDIVECFGDGFDFGDIQLRPEDLR